MTGPTKAAPERLPEDRVATITATVTSCPKIDPYVTARGGVVVLNGPFPKAKAEAVHAFIKHAQEDIVALLRERVALLAEIEQLRMGPTETSKPVDVRVRVLALSPSDAAEGLARVADRLGRETLGKAGCASDGYSQAWYRWEDRRPDGGFKQLTADDVLDELKTRSQASEGVGDE